MLKGYHFTSGPSKWASKPNHIKDSRFLQNVANCISRQDG